MFLVIYELDNTSLHLNLLELPFPFQFQFFSWNDRPSFQVVTCFDHFAITSKRRGQIIYFIEGRSPSKQNQWLFMLAGVFGTFLYFLRSILVDHINSIGKYSSEFVHKDFAGPRCCWMLPITMVALDRIWTWGTFVSSLPALSDDGPFCYL